MGGIRDGEEYREVVVSNKKNSPSVTFENLLKAVATSLPTPDSEESSQPDPSSSASPDQSCPEDACCDDLQTR